jgi:hypothetical protein
MYEINSGAKSTQVGSKRIHHSLSQYVLRPQCTVRCSLLLGYAMAAAVSLMLGVLGAKQLFKPLIYIEGYDCITAKVLESCPHVIFERVFVYNDTSMLCMSAP